MTKPPVPSADAAVTRLALFGPPPLLAGEDAAAYDELPARVSGAVKPADILEQIWVRDVVDRVCETFRRRRLKADLLAATAHESLKDILDTLTGFLRAVRAGASRRCRADVELLECSAWTVSRHLDPLLWWQKTRLPGLRLMVFYKPHPKKY